jgi:heterodisulfide reductase subunit A
VESARHPNIEIVTNAVVKEVSGSAGNFTVKVAMKPRYVDVTKCTACGVCVSYCPVPVPDTYDEDLSLRKAIHIPYAQAAPSAYVVDPEHCLFLTKKECKQCTRVCQTQAIRFGQRAGIRSFQVGALILAPGFSSFNPSRIRGLPYVDSANIVTGKEFERICCASGPYTGKILRPGDGLRPNRIAIVQCVGSRDKSTGNPYCSSVCCKYAVKDAIVALEHEPDLDITVFYMDMRMYGKGFETFYDRAKAAGVKFVRSRISEIKEEPDTADITLKYAQEDGSVAKETFNMVVLANGLESPHGSGPLAMATGIGLNPYGFCQTRLFSPLETTREGIFVAGGFQGPKSIPDSVIQAGGAAALVAELLSGERGSLVQEKAYPEERLNLDESPKVGVFVCHCGKNIGGFLNVPEVKKYAETLPNVVFVEDNLYSCSQDTQILIRDAVVANDLNRVVVAACTPRTHEPLFQDTIREAGLNKCLFEMVNIRDQCSWVHMHEREAATRKAKDLVRMAVAKASLLSPLPEPVIEVIPKGLVIGGGLSGMTAALSLARQGYECYLVERSQELGGNLRRTYFTLQGEDPQVHLRELLREVIAHGSIHVFTGATIEQIDGFVGNFRTVLSTGDGEKRDRVEIEHGAIVIATGAKPYEPDEYLYGRDEKVILQQTLEQRLALGEFPQGQIRQVVMIQCVGSRDKTHPYCSAICCGLAIKNALKIKETLPDTQVTILYRDVMTYGFDEEYYTLARDRGIVFIPYEPQGKPRVAEHDGKLRVSIKDLFLRENLTIDTDLLVLSTALVPHENRGLNEQLSVPLSSDGFFLESHAQMKPVDSYLDGIYLAGMAQFPKPMDESMAQARAAASRAAILLGKGYVKAEPIVSSCQEDLCIGCGICQDLCPYSAIRLVKKGKLKKAEVIGPACKGCGVCASYCPSRAIIMGRFTDEQIAAQIRAFGGGVTNNE